MSYSQGEQGTLQRESLSAKSFLHAQNWNRKLEEDTSKLRNQHLDLDAKVTAENFRGVALEDLHIVEWLSEVNILIYDNEVSDNGYIVHLAERPLRRPSSTVNLSYYKNRIYHITDVNKVFKWFRCSNCVIFFRRSSNWQRPLPKGDDLVRNT